MPCFYFLQNLPDKDLVGKSDPYAKVYLHLEGAKLTADDKHLKTKTHNNNQNPEFNDIFRFKVSY
jgi:Ca2+-dependent lipid-binding protein